MASATPPGRLYLRLPKKRSSPLEGSIAQIIAHPGTRPACMLLSPGTDEAWAEEILQLAHGRNIAVVVADDVELARKIGADGVHIAADASRYAAARDRLGAEAIIGADCGQNRHDAMVLAERGADYVAFEAHDPQAKPGLAELIAWWAEIFVVPCVALGVSSAEEARELTALGADFVAPADSLWQAPDPANELAAFAEALGQTRNAA